MLKNVLSDSDKFEECVADVEQKKLGLILGSSILIFVTIIFLGFMIYFTLKVFKLVWTTDKIFPMMLSMLCTSLIAVNLFWLFTIIEAANPEWTCKSGKSYECSGYVIGILPSLFLAVGVFLNLNKWIYFMLRISAFIRVGFGVKQEEK